MMAYDIAPGTRIGDFVVESLLGRGGMAEVYRARQVRLDRPVALKVVNSPLAGYTDVAARFTREATTMRDLEHPAVVPVYDAGTDKGLLYLAMRLLENATLRDRLAHGRMPVTEVLAVLRPLADALDHAHSQGVVHRDIKPANVLFDRSGRPYLADFGIAKALDSESITASGSSFGTPLYMAPEQGSGRAGHRSDLYSFGCLAFEMLTGSPPYPLTDTVALLLAHARAPIPAATDLEPALPPAVDPVLRRALAKAPEQRFGSAREFLDALTAALTRPTAEDTGPLRPEVTITDESPGMPLRSRGRPLPVPSTPLIGRSETVAKVLKDLTRPDVRVLTVTGFGGVGKTRVTLEVAARWARETGSTATFVPLAHLRDPALVLPAIGDALDVRSDGGAHLRDAVLDALRSGPSLLVLDNLEQLVAWAPELGEIVSACPQLRVLASSRTPLRLQGEHQVLLDPLAVPVGSEVTPAVELFLARTASVAPAWQPSPADVAAISELCRMLDGIPLAIELAAARMRMMRPAELLARGPGMLKMLSRGSRDAPDRHHSLHAALTWSTELLTGGGAALLRRASVWAGAWSLAAAERVCAIDDVDVDVDEAVAELVEASLVRVVHPGDGNTRYSMLAVVREFAAELLRESGEAACMEARHTAELVATVERASARFCGSDQAAALSEMDIESRTIQGVLERAVATNDSEAGQRIAGALWQYWEIRGRLAEGRRWLDRVLALPGATPHPLRAAALKAAGNLARDQYDADSAGRHLREARALYQANGDVIGVARIDNNLANFALDSGDYATAENLYRSALTTARTAGDTHLIALLSNNLALALRRHAVEQDEIIDLLNDSIAGFERIGDTREQARALESMARVLDARGEHHEALPLHIEGLQLRIRAGDLDGRIYSIEGMARSLSQLGKFDTAAHLQGHADVLREREGNPRKADDEVEVEPAAATIRAEIGDTAFALEVQRGGAMTLEQILVGVFGARAASHSAAQRSTTRATRAPAPPPTP